MLPKVTATTTACNSSGCVRSRTNSACAVLLSHGDDTGIVFKASATPGILYRPRKGAPGTMWPALEAALRYHQKIVGFGVNFYYTQVPYDDCLVLLQE